MTTLPDAELRNFIRGGLPPPWLLWHAPGEDAMLALGATALSTPDDVAEWRDWLSALTPVDGDVPLCFAVMFDPGGPADAPWIGVPRVFAFQPRRVLRLPLHVLTGRAADERAAAQSAAPVTSDGAARYIHAVEHAVSELRDGGLKKIVLARREQWREQLSLSMLLPRLAGQEQSFVIALQPDAEHLFVSLTPERLARVRDGVLHTMAVAGTTPRHADALRDAAARQALLADDKEREEHDHVLHMLMDSLRALGCTLDIEERDVLSLTHVHHLITRVHGRMPGQRRLVDVVAALHPTPAVAGVPREDAMRRIRELEGFDRGLFAGVVGWMNVRGDGDAAVTIRSTCIEHDRITAWAGAGIVRDSIPAREEEETRLKLHTVLDVLRR